MDLLFNRAKPLVEKAKTRILQNDDMLPLPQDVDPLHSILREEVLVWKSSKSFLISLVGSARIPFIPAAACLLLSGIFGLLAPILVHDFIEVLGLPLDTSGTLNRAIFLAILLGGCGIARGILTQHYFFRSLKLSQNIVSLLNRKIYLHSLRLSPQTRQNTQVGDIVNFMSSDSDAISEFLMMISELMQTILLVLGVTALLFYYIGWSAVPPLILLFGLAPLTRTIARRFIALDERMMVYRDRRVTLMSQILNAIRTIKFFSWEKSVQDEVKSVRIEELRSRRKMAQAGILSNMAYVAVSACVLLAALVTHFLRGQPLSPEIVFTCVSLFSLLAEPFGELSRVISRLSAGFVGAQRIMNFLQQKTIPAQIDLNKDENSLDVALEIKNLEFQFSEESPKLFQNLILKLSKCKTLAIVGAVGAGKSTLIQLILQELVPTAGELKKYLHRQAYVPQEAFIINGSLRENLCFGEMAISEKDLQEALYLSCLDQDIKLWPSGLETEIGEKGVNLSGGQKQRLGLARAFLSRADFVLLDDPLSAVDSETEELLCQRLLFGKWKQTTQVVATHRLQNLFRFDQILFLQDGQPAFCGNWEQLKSYPRFQEFYSNHEKTHQTMGLETQVKESDFVQSTHRITEDEDREVGAIKKSIYWDYVLSLGGEGVHRKYILLALAVGALIVSLMPLLQRGWLAKITGTQQDLLIYGSLVGLTLVIEIANNLFWLDRGIKAGQSMHDQMLESVIRAKIRFFDSTPVGRIIQRFSRDVESVDIYLQWSFDTLIHCLLFVAVSLGLILSVLPETLLFMIPILYFYYTLQRDYRRPAREAKRLDSIARSPRYAHFKETLLGLSVIRAYSKQDWFIDQFFSKLRHSQKMFYNHYLLNRWFSSRIPVIGGLISAGTCLMMVWMATNGRINPGLAGLVTVYSLSFWSFLNWGIRIFADLESRMTSVERLKNYSNLPAEIEGSMAVPDLWPEYGEIDFEQVYSRYAENLPFVLQGVTLHIPAGARVGLVGRTGSGKSTLFQTLYRLVEISEGDIKIDGLSIKQIPLNRLRRSLAIIPQDPTLFMGTLRSNLDRYTEATDAQVWEALKKTGLEKLVRSLPGELGFELNENGMNLSQGQRQLICLTRALLRNAKIVVLDEATASVDVETDVLLQQVLRESLQGVTLLIIAHRLGTVADCDLVIELSQGRVLQVLTAADLEKQKEHLKEVID